MQCDLNKGLPLKFLTALLAVSFSSSSRVVTTGEAAASAAAAAFGRLLVAPARRPASSAHFHLLPACMLNAALPPLQTEQANYTSYPY